MNRLFLLPLFLFVLLGCEEEPYAVVVPSAFRWKNSAYLSGEEFRAIEGKGIQRVYHKLLDIDWNPVNGAHPVSFVPIPYQWRDYGRERGFWTQEYELVPCIYITNNTFSKIDNAATEQLARNLLRKLRMECPAKIHGVLLDCDWTPSTKARFFRLTRIMNDSLDVPVLATIRLHQYAHPSKTGVPPADRGMLMPYNVGKLTDPGDVNSIFNKEAAEPYFANAKPYPLPLDIALPAFSWAAQFRKGAFVGILSDDQVGNALTHGLLNGETHGNLQVVREDNDMLPELHLGDVVRVERMTPEVIAQVAQLARKAVNSDTVAIAFFELGTATFQQLDSAQVQAAFRWFGPLRNSTFGGRIVQENERPVSDSTTLEVEADSAFWVPMDSVTPMPEIRRTRP